MFIILWIIFGAFVGWIASIITRNEKEMGCITNSVVGMLGSALGSWITYQITGQNIRRFSLSGMFMAIVGAVLLLTAINLLRTPKDS